MNRNRLIDAFISNVANVVLHEILEKAIDKEEIALVYEKEIKNSLEIAKKYREKINPVDRALPEIDVDEIREKVIRKVRVELNLRISKGYENIDLSLIDEIVDRVLREMKVA